MEENKRLEQGFDDPGRQILRNIIVHFTTTDNNPYGVWSDVVRQYLLTAYNTEEKHSTIPVAGKIYKILKRDGVTVFYDESGQTLFDVENDRLAKEHELLSAENAAEEPVKSYFTMEWNHNKISQCRGMKNCGMPPEVRAFTQVFEKKMQEAVKKDDKKPKRRCG